MREAVGTLKTTVVSDDAQTHVYEICREFDTTGEEVILLTLYPTLTEPNTFDLSSMHLMNHAFDEGLQLQKVHFVFLFSKVVGAKLSTRNLKMDEQNMQYLRELISKLPKAKIIISFGSSMHNCPAVIESKVELFKMIKELRPKDTNLGWDIEDINDEGCELPFPSLQDVYDNLQAEIEASSYDAELKGNVRAFLQVRLGGLMERDAGELFNSHISTLTPDEWLTVSAIVELEVLGEQAKNFFVLLVCHYILETLRANPNGGVDSKGQKLPVRHVIFIEEAHNIIAPSTQQASADSVDPKISATAYIVKMLAEVRALREAIVIADQLPTALASEVTKNTGLKLVHRLTAQDDREQIGTAISASPLQLEQMASFTTGKALIYHERTQKPFTVQIAEWMPPDIDYDIATDVQLYNRIAGKPTIQRAVTSAFRNWQDKCMFTVDDRLTALQQRYLATKATDVSEMMACKFEKLMLLAECEMLQKKCKRLERLWMKGDMKNSPLRDEFSEIFSYIENMTARVRGIQIIE